MLYYKSLRCHIIKRKWNNGERNCTIVHYIAVALDGSSLPEQTGQQHL